MKRIAVLGGGPGGLYFAYLWKKRHPQARIDVFEQSPPDATWGFGVVFSERALDFIRDGDAETADLITPHMESWSDITVAHQGERIALDGIGFSAIGRLEFLQLLQKMCASVGIEPRFNHTVHSLDELQGYDLIVAADGLNSLVRRTFEGDFQTSLSYMSNKFAWYGTTKRFETLTQTFVKTDKGAFNAHHYRYSPSMSTFIVECDHETWLNYGFDTASLEYSQQVCEDVFAETLDGHKLVSNRSIWRNFPWLWNDRWHFRNMVLIGDALHTAHFSIGSGTRLAMEDVIALVRALEDKPDDLKGALQLYQDRRKPIVEKLVAAAKSSANWYENFRDHLALEPIDFAYSYINRTGRVDPAKLHAHSPKFSALYESKRGPMTKVKG